MVFRGLPEPDLFTADLDSRIPRGSEAWWVRVVLSEMDLSSLHELYQDLGGVAYHPSQMLGVLLLGYMLGVTSSRDLEDRCLYDHRFIWVARGLTPDDRTIGRFRRRIAPAMDGLFSAFVDLARAKGMLTLRRVAVDGTKLQSAAGGLAKWLRLADTADAACGLELPECSDPEALLMPGRSGGFVGYNAQAAVDVDSGLVVATSVADSVSDRAQLAPMLDRVREITGDVPQEIVADRGYDSAEGLQALEDAQVQAYVAPQDAVSSFWTAVSPTEVVCPMGHAPDLVSQTQEDGHRLVRLRVSACASCMFYGSCCSTRQGRSLSVPVGVDPVLRVLAAHRAREPGHKTAMRDRMASVEPFFAQVKANRRMGRLKLRTKNGAALEFALMALARNLKVLQNLLEPPYYLFWALPRPTKLILRAAQAVLRGPGGLVAFGGG